jgi:hypothetical protein
MASLGRVEDKRYVLHKNKFYTENIFFVDEHVGPR